MTLPHGCLEILWSQSITMVPVSYTHLDVYKRQAQASLIEKMLERELLTEKELDIYKRGRNAKSHTKAKNTDVITYKMSTGFEAVMGYLHMTEDIDRLEELVAWCIDEVEKEI